MNTKHYKTLIGLLNTVNASFVIYALILALLYTIGESKYALLSAFLLVIPIISYYLEHHAKHIITFLIYHMLLGIFFFLLPQSPIVKIIYVIYIAIVMIYHFSRRIKKEHMIQGNMSYAFFILLIAIQIYANWNKIDPLSHLIHIIAILCTILFFINMYLLNFTGFFTNVTINTDVNFQRIKGINHSFILGFISITTLFMIGSYSISLYPILSTMKSVILYLLRLFFSLFRTSNEMDEVDMVVESAPLNNEFYLGETKEPNPIWLMLQEIFSKLFTVAIILSILCLIGYGIYKLYQHFHSIIDDETDNKEFVSPFQKEASVNVMRKLEKKQLHLFLNNNEKIRRYFYLEIKKKYKDKVPYNYTADELLNLSIESIGLLLSKEPEKLDPKLLKLYHKARYSKERCTKEEVNQVKSLIKNNK